MRHAASGCLFIFSGALVACGLGEIGDVPRDDAVLLDAAPGDEVELGGVIARAPLHGEGVWAEIIRDDGTTETLHLETLLDGRVFWLPELLHDDEEAGADDEAVDGQAAGEATASGSPGPCKDKARNLLPFRWDNTFAWRFRAGSTPSGLSKDAVEKRLRWAATNITRSDNSCSMSDLVSAKHRYDGRTTRGVQISAAGGCGTRNGHNTVAFGDLPAGVLGVACTWYSSGAALESDIKLNKADHKWTAAIGSTCKSRYSVEAVATHEFGHVFGLGHVSESSHGNLTMSTAINGPCQNAESTLGRGDVLGLRAIY
jgi:hypothetical protein